MIPRTRLGRRSAVALFVAAAVVVAAVLAAVLLGGGSGTKRGPVRPIALDPQNPHYFVFRGRPTVLVTSAEHYGAVVDAGFDYERYLDALRRDGLNMTRIFTGSFVGLPGQHPARGYTDTLAGGGRQFIVPWARSRTPGARDGGSKFDLNHWDPEYFKRLRGFVSAASARGIVVEITLFSSYYTDQLWHASPLNAANNINEVGTGAFQDAYSGKDRALFAAQASMAREVVGSLRDFDNVYYEILNEPYFANTDTTAWQRQMVGVVRKADAGGPGRHMIAEGFEKPAQVDGALSVLNFHPVLSGLAPEEVVSRNYGLNRAIADDETGNLGTDPSGYRREGWRFMLSGGAVFDNLDRSFSAESPSGTAPIPAKVDGSGGPALRRQLAVLKRFVEGFDFVRMKPDTSVVKAAPGGTHPYVLADAGRAYAIYLDGGGAGKLAIALPAGRYGTRWTDPVTGRVTPGPAITQRQDGVASLAVPAHADAIALTVRRQG